MSLQRAESGSHSGSVGEMTPLQLEEFDDVTMLLDKPPQSRASRMWGKFKSAFSMGNGKKGFQKLDTTEGHGRDPGERWCPEEQAGGFSRFFFMFANGLMNLGYKKHLETEDLWDVGQIDKATTVVDVFDRNLELTREPIKAPQGSVVGTMWRTHRKKFVTAGLIKVVHDVLQFLGPFILGKLLADLEKEEAAKDSGRYGDAQHYLIMGLFLAVAMMFASIVQTILVNQYFHMLFRISLHLKAQLVHMLYRKSLRITSAVKSEKGVGAIVNLQSNDASKLWTLPQYLHVLWSGPFQILTVMGMLVSTIGWAPSFAGLMVTVALIPLNAFVGKKMAKFRKEQMKHTDARVKLATEVVTGIKAIKLYAWERPYLKKIAALREKELHQIMKTRLFGCINRMFFSSGPILVSLAAFGVFVWTDGKLTASIAFPSLALFNLLRFPIMMFPNQIMNLINGKVALKRIQTFMESDEVEQLPPAPAIGRTSQANAVSVSGGTFSWGPGEMPILADLNFQAQAGKLIMVVGEVGSGKSSLLAAILGEMHQMGGKAKVAGSLAYTAQDPWIQNATLQNNIIMGREFDEDRYARVLYACALMPDMQNLAAGDQTEIGEKGVNLSGGQKHRVALARACYMNSDVMLMDDPLSAVDAHVGRQLFDECICGLLEGKTRILVTHQLQFLPHADQVVVLEKGRISDVGTYEELTQRGVKFNELKVKEEDKASNSGSSDDAEEALNNSRAREKDTSKSDREAEKKSMEQHQETKALVKQMSMRKGNLTKGEDRSVGRVKKAVYSSYLKAWGPCMLIPITLIIAATTERGLQVAQNFWLSVWTSGSKGTAFYLSIYFVLGFVSILFSFLGTLTLLIGSINASRKLHNDLLSKIIRLPMSFFDTQPSGRLINRFARDIEALDTEVAQVISMAMNCVVSVLFSILVVAGVTQAVIVAIIILAFLYHRIQRQYLATTRELKRLDSLALSPIFGHFNETLQGLQTIRAFRKQGDFAGKNEDLIDGSNRTNWPLVTTNRWLSVRLEVMSSAIVFLTAVVVAIESRWDAGLAFGFKIDAGKAGLALTSALNLTGLMNWAVRQTTQLEVSMNCVERVIEYSKYESEKAEIISNKRPPSRWPRQGSILVQNLWLRYRPELDPVLKGISFKINGGEKVGVCGRTGCGKSTLMMALYRIVEPFNGSVMIDGVDTDSIGLYDLRSHLSLVPQDPVIFSGSVRTNLDPFSDVGGDAKIWEAIKRAGLDEFMSKQEGGLDAPIQEGGQNLSVGQRQLLCMARALLRESRILILDEATSNVDTTTDALIQETIRSAFSDCTVLTIAHRLHTIIDYDKIMVLDAGEVKEFDSPENLLADPDSMFNKLVEESTRGREGKVKRSDSTVELLEKTKRVRGD